MYGQQMLTIERKRIRFLCLTEAHLARRYGKGAQDQLPALDEVAKRLDTAGLAQRLQDEFYRATARQTESMCFFRAQAISNRRRASRLRCAAPTYVKKVHTKGGSSAFLARRTKQNLIHVHFRRLTDGERHCPSERLGWNCILLVELAYKAGHIGLGDACWQIRGDRSR